QGEPGPAAGHLHDEGPGRRDRRAPEDPSPPRRLTLRSPRPPAWGGAGPADPRGGHVSSELVGTRRRVAGAVALAAALVALAACAGLRSVETRPPAPTPRPTNGPADDSSPDATAPVTTAPGSPEVFAPDPRRPSQPYDEALSAALLDIQAFWRQIFP